ncbi:MAG TPA: wax ester/triacylglycerol synthase domain-containing protein, partial [Steroidobacteraceae bacterium]|nr:wax ester/triacylglycerol synthase domain-containing protein [Steroidobacteraceae bacterium]
MRQLTAAEARFLYSDSDHANSNITLVQIYAPADRAPRLRFKWLLAHVASRLGLWPPFREKLLRVPFDLDRPWWIEDERFDLEYHVRHIALPEPGDWRQFCIQASRIHARPLDMTRPLWELYLVEGLDSIDGLPRHSFAILCKVHHAAIHLAEGADLAVLLHDAEPQAGKPSPPEPWFPDEPPEAAPILVRAVANNLFDPLAALKRVTRSVSQAGPAVLGFAGEAIRHPERFPTARFNAEVSPHRVFETRRFDVADFERIRRLVRSASIDDVVLAICGGALRRYLECHEELPAASLVALAPQSVHGVAPTQRRHEDDLHRIELGTD